MIQLSLPYQERFRKVSSSTTTSVQEGSTTNLETKSIEGWWRTSKAGKVYAEYDKAGILENPLGFNPGFEKLVPDHLDKNDKSKYVWQSPIGITYYIFEADETDQQGKTTGAKKHLLFRVKTDEYRQGGAAKGNWKSFKQWPVITDEMTVFQFVSMENDELKRNSTQAYQSDQVSYLMSDAGGKWKPAASDFKQIHADFAKREILIVYQLVQRAKEDSKTS